MADFDYREWENSFPMTFEAREADPEINAPAMVVVKQAGSRVNLTKEQLEEILKALQEVESL